VSPRNVRIARGTEDTNISSSAGAAALAKKASEDALHTAVDKVLNPSGLKINVAGSSFIVSKNTIANPAINPGRSKGKVIDRITDI